MNLKKWIIVLFSSALILNSCDDDQNIITGIFTDGAFISNEGTYGSGNGSLSFYSYDKDSLFNNVFYSVNKRVLGDVVQSLSIHEDLVYIVVNVSNKVEVASRHDLIEKGVITDVVNPRYFLGISHTKGYVSQWEEGGAIKVIDLSTFEVTKTISAGAGAEKMLLFNNMVYVANSGGYANNNTVSVINTTTDEVVKTITLDGDSPRDLVSDINGDIWVLCSGYVDYTNYPDITETPSKLVKINSVTNEIDQTITIGDYYHPTSLEISNDKQNLIYGGGFYVQGIYKMSINDQTAPTTPLIDKLFYGLEINPETNEIYAMEAPSYTVNGTLWRYKIDGTELGSYEAGISPNSAGFKKK